MSKCDIQPLAPKMNPELKARWLKALRSGTYLQGQKALHKESKFCCLGVLCDLGLPEKWEPSDWDSDYYIHPWGNPHDELLSKEISYEIKLGNALQRRLADMNDQGKSFIEIAEVIEAEA
jgi:hypothetical protein